MKAPRDSWAGSGFALSRADDRLVGVFTQPMSEAAAHALEHALRGSVHEYLHIAAPDPTRPFEFGGESVLRLRLLRLLREFRALDGRMALVLDATGFRAAAYRAFGYPVLSAVRLRAEYRVFGSVDAAALWLAFEDRQGALERIAHVMHTRAQARQV